MPNPRAAAEILLPCKHVTTHRVDGSSIGCNACIIERAKSYARQQVEVALERAAEGSDALAERLADLLVREDIEDDGLREASETLLPQIHDFFLRLNAPRSGP